VVRSGIHPESDELVLGLLSSNTKTPPVGGVFGRKVEAGREGADRRMVRDVPEYRPLRGQI
jgi:hypothetical protein